MGGREDVPSCHKVNVFVSLKFPLLAVPAVVYVVRGFVWNLRREPQTRLGVISPTHTTHLSTTTYHQLGRTL